MTTHEQFKAACECRTPDRLPADYQGGVVQVTRRKLLKVAAVSLGGLLLPLASLEGQHDGEETRSPNILFIMCDEMREMAMSCAGNPNVETPNMDRLASDGVRWTRMYTPSPVCSPARASVHTGLYPHRTGLNYKNGTHLREDIPTLAEILSRVGYTTGHIGKWHLNGRRLSKDRYVPPKYHRGFDYWAGYEHGHDYFGANYYTDTPKAIVTPKDSYEPDVQTDLALKFIKRNREKSWYLDLSWGPPHFPLTPENVKLMDLNGQDPKSIRLRPNVPADLQDEARRDLAIYYAMIENLDQNLGRLLDELDQLGLTKRTIVVFTSDHGDMMLSHGQHYKRRPKEESVRVPFLIRYPQAIPHGQVISELGSLVDCVPTLLDLAGVQGPAGDGVTLAPLMRKEVNAGPRDSVYMGCAWFGCRDYDQGLHRKSHWRAVRTKTTMAAYLDNGKGRAELVELFDLKNDPYQLRNRVGHKESLMRSNMNKILRKYIRETNDSHFMNLRSIDEN
jgi:arylsulfatase A-like enzyme